MIVSRKKWMLAALGGVLLVHTFCRAQSGAPSLVSERSDTRRSDSEASAPLTPPGLAAPLNDAALFAALDLTNPQLAPVRAALDANDRDRAIHALAQVLRQRALAAALPATLADSDEGNYTRQMADDVAQGRIKIVAVTKIFAQGRINWFANATNARSGVARNSEWQWQLNRMGFWRALTLAYRQSGDEKYARAWVSQMKSWVNSAPVAVPKNRKDASAWRTIDVGHRMSGSWREAYETFRTSPSISDDDWMTFLRSVVQQGRFARTHNNKKGNWRTIGMNGLYTIGALYPFLKEAREWRTYAATTMQSELNAQFLPDGGQIELSPKYHSIALNQAVGLFLTATRFGQRAELPADYIARCQHAFDYELGLMTPDRNLPRLNDSGFVNVQRDFARAAALFPTRRDFAWAAAGAPTDSRDVPSWASRDLPYAGYYVMRSDWSPQANFAVFDDGPLGFGHYHQDKLNLALWAYGQEILFDSGGGQYEKSAWRDYAVDTFSHNTVLVDGQPQRRQTRIPEANISRAPIQATWRTSPLFDTVRGNYTEGYGSENARPARHTRQILFVKPDVWIVADTLASTDGRSHNYQARWHLLPTQTQLDAATQSLSTTTAGQPNLAVVPLLTAGLSVKSASGQTEPEILGWNFRRDLSPQQTPATTLLHTRSGPGVQRFLTLLLPLRKGQSDPVQSVRSIGTGRVRVQLRDGRIWTISNLNSGLQFNEQWPAEANKKGRFASS